MEGEEPDGLKHWRYVIEEVLPASEWQKRVEAERAEYESHTDEAILEMDELICETADKVDALVNGGME